MSTDINSGVSTSRGGRREPEGSRVSDPARPTPLRPVAVVSLDALAEDPARAASLPAEVKRTIVLTCSAIISACAAGPDTSSIAPAREPDRVLLIDEAAARLGMTKDFLYRRWPALHLGYKDADGRVKFPLSKIERYIRTRTGTPA
jgi:hypothetical protein